MSPSPQPTRKASMSIVNKQAKRTRSVSTSTKVSHHTIANDGDKSPQPVPLQISGASLGCLPDELLLNIMEHLDGHKAALAKLCRTSKRFRNIAQEVLYRTINSFMGNHRNAYAVARSPSLARYVRVFKDFRSCTRGTKSDRKAYLRVLEKAHNIQFLTVELDEDNYGKPASTRGRPRSFIEIIGLPIKPHNRFAQLKRLCLIAEPYAANTIPAELLSVVFRPSTLEILELDGYHQTTPYEDWPVPKSSSTIKELVVRDAMMDTTFVVQMITSLKAPRRIKYHFSTMSWEPFADEDDPVSVWPEHSWELLGDAIRQHQHCLQILALSEESDPEVVNIVHAEGRELGFLGSFSDFPLLKDVSAPIEAFMDFDAGEKDLSAYLPAQLHTFFTYITSFDAVRLTLAAEAVLSLKTAPARHGLDDVGFDLEGTVRTRLHKSPQFGNTLRKLAEAGVKVAFSDSGSDLMNDSSDDDSWYDVDSSDEEGE